MMVPNLTLYKLNVINNIFYITVESSLINPQAGAISLASLQPPLMTAPPLQPRPATTGSLDLMLPLQPKLLPGYNLQSSYLSNTLSTVRPPDLHSDSEAYKPKVEVIVEKRESVSDCSTREILTENPDEESTGIDVCNKDDNKCSNCEKIHDEENENFNVLVCPFNGTNDNENIILNCEINSNIIDAKTANSNLVNNKGDASPNNNSL